MSYYNMLALALGLRVASARVLETFTTVSSLTTKSPSRREESAVIPTFTFGPKDVYFPVAVRYNLFFLTTALT
jgi:hypothetical protein